jgi:hypothetical protein
MRKLTHRTDQTRVFDHRDFVIIAYQCCGGVETSRRLPSFLRYSWPRVFMPFINFIKDFKAHGTSPSMMTLKHEGMG